MCGILGIVAKAGEEPRLTENEVLGMRDSMFRRGPDQAGLKRRDNWILAHRRLAVRDLSATGAQPMATPDGRFQLVYNGELYNDSELRLELESQALVPGGFRGSCDTETVLWAFAAWGPAAFAKLRGMFAIAIYDRQEQCLHLARDPLGIKPLYYHQGSGHQSSGEFVFASEIPAILAHPNISPEPDLALASSYLTTLRTVLGSRTLFEGVRSLEPGQQLSFDARSGSLESRRFHNATAASERWTDMDSACAEARAVMKDSVRSHLTADVPISALLSGGLDSTILCNLAQAEVGDLHTWCAGADDQSDPGEDFHFAREVAESIGSVHSEVRLGGDRFRRDWAWMIRELGTPLSTPNEVAIHAVCRDLRDKGRVVTISGEGADELFGGYELSMQAVADHMAQHGSSRGGAYHLKASAWISPDTKSKLLNPGIWNQLDGDSFLNDHYDRLYARCESEAGEGASGLEPHLRFLRHNNLTGLLGRLDSSSMLASVEGRTPFADTRVLQFAESLPMECKFQSEGNASQGGTATLCAVRGKRVLRRAWRERIATSIETRPKHSFPLPFQSWMAEVTPVLERSTFAREFFDQGLRRELAANPETYWQCAWPMLNLALWGERWWG